MGFAEEFIQGFSVGQRNRLEKESGERDKKNQLFTEWQQEVEKQDRDIHKNILAHQLKALKINDQVLARDQIAKQIEQLQGTDIMAATPDQTEGGVLPSMNPLTGVTQTRFKPVDVPGIDELGVPGYKKAPQSMQEVMAQKAKEARIAQDIANTKPVELSYGARLVQPSTGAVLADNPRDPDRVWVRTRDARGKLEMRRVTEEEAASHGWEQEPVPHYGGVTISTPDQLENITAGFASGMTPMAWINGLSGRDKAAVIGGLNKAGVNQTRMALDQAAMTTFIKSMNSGDQANMVTAAETFNDALSDLETANAAWDRNTYGPLTRVSVAIAKRRGGPEAAKALEVEAAIQRVKDSLAVLKSGGSKPTNDALKAVEDVLSDTQGKVDLNATIQRLKREGTLRVAGIRGAAAVLSDPNAPGNAGAAAAPGGLPKLAPPPPSSTVNTVTGKPKTDPLDLGAPPTRK